MKSMTGFGKKTIQNENYQLDVEVKSVNQRFLDIQLRMPKELNAYELVIRQVIKRTLKHGRVLHNRVATLIVVLTCLAVSKFNFCHLKLKNRLPLLLSVNSILLLLL